MDELDCSSGSEAETVCHDDVTETKEKPELPHSARDRWGRLKTTMTVTNQITVKKNRRLDRGDSFLRKFSTRNQAENEVSPNTEDSQTETRRNTKHRTLKSFVIHPSGGFMFYWLGVVTLSVLYNLWTCIAREAFREIQKGYMTVWFCFDGLSDFVYICDIFVQFRTGYLQQGLMVYESSKLCKNYMKDRWFVADVVSLLPLDLLQFYTGVHPMLRFPRFLKIYRSIRFMHMYESRTAYPNLLRVASLSHILFLGSHWFAAFYYLISEAEGFQGDWSYHEPIGDYAAVTRKYLASLYWSTLTLTTIGDLPPPDTNWQYVFVIVSYLIGVFIFATIVGQVGNVITNRNASRQEFERLLDGAKFYMQMHNVPPELQKRVQRWYDYVWTRGRLNCNDINSLGLLPDKLKTELALHVNLGTLKKVTIFQKCRPEFLHDLMLKMRAYIFTPGDLICRRGEVAREMFIIADGVVEILGDNAVVLTQMSTGDFFGEIGILNLDGGINRRTADVRSVGYSELFVLSREDVLAALKDHPDAEQIIREYGQRRLKETVEHRKMVKSTPSSPEPSVFRGNRGTNKIFTENQNSGSHKSHVKYLNKLPHMSPKLKKLFHLKNKRLQKRQQRQNSDMFIQNSTLNSEPTKDFESQEINKNHIKDNGVLKIPRLQAVDDKEQSLTDSEQDLKHDQGNKANNANLADLVLNLLKSKRQVGYSTVQSDEAEIEKQFDEIPIANLNEITSDVNEKGTGRLHNGDTDTKRGVNQIQTNGSIGNESEDDVFTERPTSPNSLHIRNHIGRKSSPCILPPPRTMKTGEQRKFSCAPPLDLPIEVPPFSNFRGLTGNSTEISFTLDRFKSEIEQRLVTMETSYKETHEHLHDALSVQERLIRNILRKLTVKDKGTEDLSSSTTQVMTVVNDDMRSKSLSTSVSGSVPHKGPCAQGETNVQVQGHINKLMDSTNNCDHSATNNEENKIEQNNENITSQSEEREHVVDDDTTENQTTYL